MADDFEYISHARLVYKDGYRNAYLGEVPEAVVYGVQGALRVGNEVVLLNSELMGE